MDKIDYQPKVEVNKNLDETLLTVKEVANIVGETPNVVRNWMKDLKGYIPTQKNESGYNVFNAEALEQIKLIKQLHREQNYSVKQIKHYFDTGGDSYIPKPKKGTDDILYEELSQMKNMIKELSEENKRQQEFNHQLIKKLDDQDKYIRESLNKRDEKILETMKEMQETKRLTAAPEEKEQKEEKTDDAGFWAKLFKGKS